MIKHTHNLDGESSVWHDGSLVGCPDSTWTEIVLEDGRVARFYHGMSVSPPPDTANRFRRIVDAPAII